MGESVLSSISLCPDGKGDYTCGGQDQRGESKGVVYGGQVKQVMIQKKLLAVVPRWNR